MIGMDVVLMRKLMRAATAVAVVLAAGTGATAANAHEDPQLPGAISSVAFEVPVEGTEDPREEQSPSLMPTGQDGVETDGAGPDEVDENFSIDYEGFPETVSREMLAEGFTFRATGLTPGAQLRALFSSAGDDLSNEVGNVGEDGTVEVHVQVMSASMDNTPVKAGTPFVIALRSEGSEEVIRFVAGGLEQGGGSSVDIMGKASVGDVEDEAESLTVTTVVLGSFGAVLLVIAAFALIASRREKASQGTERSP